MKAFPELKIVAALESWWDREVEAAGGDPFSTPKGKGTLYELLPTADSLTMVNALLAVEQYVDLELPAGIVKRGGYATRDEMINHLVPRIQSFYNSKRR